MTRISKPDLSSTFSTLSARVSLTLALSFLLASTVAGTLAGCSLIELSQDPSRDPYRYDLTDDLPSTSSAPERHAASNLSPEEREELRISKHRRIRSAVSSGDLVLGMRMQDVRGAWGEPREVESAGFPGSGNQRWIYQHGLASSQGFGSTRTVYFEDGKVVGWGNADR
ncbi:MAG: hypothetical protein H7222_08195 [Methylotenera sp.]|nr:hypothetical protein [Oligoflexia bacterium]